MVSAAIKPSASEILRSLTGSSMLAKHSLLMRVSHRQRKALLSGRAQNVSIFVLRRSFAKARIRSVSITSIMP